MKEDKKKQQPDSFLSQELIDETQVQIPIGYEVVNKYPLLPPFSYVNILYNSEKSNYLYFVDEVRLSAQEKQLPRLRHASLLLAFPVGKFRSNIIWESYL